jgi:hydroxylamine reductase (hybrid-cluster protein)
LDLIKKLSGNIAKNIYLPISAIFTLSQNLVSILNNEKTIVQGTIDMGKDISGYTLVEKIFSYANKSYLNC